jgi:hypothetical protein
MIYKMEIILRIITNFVTCKIIQVTCKAQLHIKNEGRGGHPQHGKIRTKLDANVFQKFRLRKERKSKLIEKVPTQYHFKVTLEYQ